MTDFKDTINKIIEIYQNRNDENLKSICRLSLCEFNRKSKGGME